MVVAANAQALGLCPPTADGAKLILSALLTRVEAEAGLTPNVLQARSTKSDNKILLARFVTEGSMALRKHNFVLRIYAGKTLGRLLGMAERPAGRVDAQRIIWSVGAGDWISTSFPSANWSAESSETTLTCSAALQTMIDAIALSRPAEPAAGTPPTDQQQAGASGTETDPAAAAAAAAARLVCFPRAGAAALVGAGLFRVAGFLAAAVPVAFLGGAGFFV